MRLRSLGLRYLSGRRRRKLTEAQSALKSAGRTADALVCVLSAGIGDRFRQGVDTIEELDQVDELLTSHLKPAIVAREKAWDAFGASFKGRKKIYKI